MEELISAQYASSWAHSSLLAGTPLAGHALILVAAVLLDLLLGDPVYPAHPIRLMGHLLALIERGLRRIGFDGYGGGILLFVLLSAHLRRASLILVLARPQRRRRAVVELGRSPASSLQHARARRSAASRLALSSGALERGALADGREAIARLVGRDTASDGRRRLPPRRGREPQREPHRWLRQPAVLVRAARRLPGIVLFKVVSTMDSMVGYKTPRYLQFGWCGARLDDVMNYVPARLTWLLIALTRRDDPRLLRC